MEIERVELVRVELELVAEVASAAGVHRRRPLVLVHVVVDGADGWGECAALEAPTYSAEYADGAWGVLAEHLAPALTGQGHFTSVEEALRPLGRFRGHEMAKAALELALLDATLRAEGLSLAAHLGATATTLAVGATLGLNHPDAVVWEAAGLFDLGYRRFKVKIEPGHDVEVIRALRDALPEVVLAADANGSYDANNEEHRRALLGLGDEFLSFLEQPFAPDDLVGHARLTRERATPVVLDESIVDPGDLELAITLSACDGISLKPARVGGVLAARRLHDRCLDAGLHLVAGGMLESGIGRAGALAVAALPGFDLPGDLGPSDRYFARDLAGPHALRDGALVVPDGPGLGVPIDTAFIDEVTAGKLLVEQS